MVLTLGCQFLSPLAEDIERLVLLYWYLPIHQSYLTFDKLDTGLSWDIYGISKYHQKMAERKMEKNDFTLIIIVTQHLCKYKTGMPSIIPEPPCTCPQFSNRLQLLFREILTCFVFCLKHWQVYLVSLDVLGLTGEGDGMSDPDWVVGERPQELRLGVLALLEGGVARPPSSSSCSSSSCIEGTVNQLYYTTFKKQLTSALTGQTDTRQEQEANKSCVTEVVETW